LSTANIAALTTAQAVALETADVAALTTSQVVAITTAGLNALTTTQLRSLESSDVAALSTIQIAALTTANLAALTTTQISAITSSQADALTTGQVEALTTSQMQALTTTAVAALHMGTPIILDLNGDGVKTLSISEGVKFDLFANGKDVNTGWVSSNDGLLVLDRNHDGQINDGSELFGSSTTLADGSKASDGYAALRELDSNQDGVVSQDDAAFADLRVWVDANSDGVTESGEIKTMASLGISSISTQAAVDLSKDNGNLVGLTSTYETTDGATHAAADVWFVADKNQVMTPEVAVDNAIAALNSVASASGGVATPDALPSDAIVSLLPAQMDPAPAAAGATDLRSRVSSLAQAMGTFSDASGSADALSTPRLDVLGSSTPTLSVTSIAVASMVDVMKQFDSNGNLLGPQAAMTASLGRTPSLTGAQESLPNGFLATAGNKLSS
jgi:hypothetical protein